MGSRVLGWKDVESEGEGTKTKGLETKGFIGPRNKTTLNEGGTRALGPKDLEFEREGIKA